MKIIKAILLLAVFLIALALGAQNQQVVNFNYLLAKGDFNLSFLLGGVFAAGFLLAWLILGSMQLKSQLQIKKLSRQLKKKSATLPVESKA